jgi:hypothetical protein
VETVANLIKTGPTHLQTEFEWYFLWYYKSQKIRCQ